MKTQQYYLDHLKNKTCFNDFPCYTLLRCQNMSVNVIQVINYVS